MVTTSPGGPGLIAEQAIAAPQRVPGHPSAPLLGSTVAVLVLAIIKLIATVASSGAYGFHRDELYYLACARHLALGYVDFPPVTPLLAWIDTAVLGTSLVGLRLIPALSGVAIILLTGRITRELGGPPFVQFLAALATLMAPMVLGANTVFETVTFDQLAWLILLFLMVRLLTAESPRLWPAIGLAIGVGLMTKYTILALVLGLGCGILLTPQRAWLRTRGPWLAALIALAVLAPNLVWQIQHGWPSLSYLHTHHANIAQDTSHLAFFAEQIAYTGPLALPLALLGLYSLFARRRYRVLGWACIIVELSLALAGGKSYYAGPIYPLLFAAGSVQLVHAVSGRRAIWMRSGATCAILLGGLVLLPLSLPVLSANAMVRSGIWKVRTDYADEVGWPELVAAVARVYDQVPVPERASTAIFTGNYGEAGAIDLYGSRYGLPHALSGHLTYWYWKPAHVDARTLVAVGMSRSDLAPLYRDVRLVGVIRNTLGLHNEEWGTPIYLCHGPKVSLDRAWPSLRHED